LTNENGEENIEKYIKEIESEGFDCFKSSLGGPGLIFENLLVSKL
jgi:hypothetical protein